MYIISVTINGIFGRHRNHRVATACLLQRVQAGQILDTIHDQKHYTQHVHIPRTQSGEMPFTWPSFGARPTGLCKTENRAYNMDDSVSIFTGRNRRQHSCIQKARRVRIFVPVGCLNHDISYATWPSCRALWFGPRPVQKISSDHCDNSIRLDDHQLILPVCTRWFGQENHHVHVDFRPVRDRDDGGEQRSDCRRQHSVCYPFRKYMVQEQEQAVASMVDRRHIPTGRKFARHHVRRHHSGRIIVQNYVATFIKFPVRRSMLKSIIA